MRQVKKRLKKTPFLLSIGDPPDDDEAAEPFLYDSEEARRRQIAEKRKSKLALLLAVSPAFLVLFFLFIDATEDSFTVITLTVLAAIVYAIVTTIQSILQEGFNWYNLTALFLCAFYVLFILGSFLG